jgi:DNA repair exonuclease SbcCD nuclease subunit
MFRFIHSADLHLDSPLRGLEAREGAPGDQLRAATRRATENLVDLALREQVGFVLIAGDVYDGDWRDYSTGLFFRRQLVRLRDAGIPVCLISGNHDAASVISRKLELPNNVHSFSTRSAETHLLPGLPVAVHGRSFPHRAVPENLALDYPEALPDRFNIGLLHTSLTGREGHDSYAPCTETDLRSRGYAYWALGHIHQPEIVARDPWMVFAGNVQGRHIRETGPRGCQLVTVDDSLRVVSVEHRPLDVVRWQEIQVDLTGCEREEEAMGRLDSALGATLASAEGRLVAARVVFAGSTRLHGSLHRDTHRWRAAVVGRAQDHGSDRLWIERLRMATTARYDLNQLAERDALTRLVLESLSQAVSELASPPDAFTEMLQLMPVDVRSDLEAAWQPGRRPEVLADVRALILESLGTQGGESR